VWHELTYGCKRLPRGKRREAIETYLQDVVLASFPVLAYDEDAAHWHGIERARLEGLGRPAPFVDGQIAAIAYVNELTLVTVNVKDFARFKGVHVENWSKRRS
jgi:tRNA(fMet)-specific endonuclease VapC